MDRREKLSRVAIAALIGAVIVQNPPFPRRSDPPGSGRRDTVSASTGFILPAKGRITKAGERISISGNLGDPVVAAANGVVIKSQWDDSGEGLGQMIVIRHNHLDKLTIYAHNHKRLVNTGQRVQRGDAIAQMGATGKSSHNHLRFEIRDANGRALNPCNFVPCP